MISYASSGRLPRGITPLLLKRIATACASVRGLPKKGVVSLRFVPEAEIQRLNHACRGKNKPTDVLSFSLTEGGAFPMPRGTKEPIEVGDVVVCASIARAEAKRRAMDPLEELVRLIAHGTLHLAGYDHATEKEEEVMFGLQENIVARAMPANSV